MRNASANHELSPCTSNVLGSKTKIIDQKSITADSLSYSSEREGGGISSFFLMSVQEAESIVDSLRPFSLDEIGSSEFLYMFAYQVERLSLQAHATAKLSMMTGDGCVSSNDFWERDENEFVVETILDFEKIPTLVKTLLAVELWRCSILPHSFQEEQEKMIEKSFLHVLAKHGNTLRIAYTLHVETTLVCLLTLILFRRRSVRDMDGDTAIALVDYCARQMICLARPIQVNDEVRRQKEPLSSQELMDKIKHRTTHDDIMDTILDTNYKTCVAATSLARYLCEHLDCLPLGAQTRILDTHDYLMIMVPLIDEPPWTRRRKNASTQTMVWEKLMENNAWVEVAPSDLLQITKCEAQCWLSIFCLTCSETSRKHYALNSFRKDQLLRLRKFLNEIMIDQLPVLSDVLQFMDCLAVTAVPENNTRMGSAMLIQEADSIRESVLVGVNLSDVVRNQFDNIFSKVTDANDTDLRLISTIYDLNIFGALVDNSSQQYEILSEPLHSIALRRSDQTKPSEDLFVLQPTDDFTIIQTPSGHFRRTKLSIVSPQGDMLLTLPCKNVVAKVYFKGVDEFSRTLYCDNLLPDSTSTTKKIWRQLGSLDERIILQLRFLMEPNELDGLNWANYRLDQAFFSQPIDS